MEGVCPRGAPLGTLTIVGHGRGPGAELGTARTCEKLVPELLHFRQEAAVLGAGVLVEIALRSRKMGPAGEEGPGKPLSHLLAEHQGLPCVPIPVGCPHPEDWLLDEGRGDLALEVAVG